MQAPLALLGFLLGLIAWWQASHAGFLIGAIAMIAPWPWTLIVIKPTNDALLATELDQAGPQTRALIVRWGGAARRALCPRRARHRCIFVGMYVALARYTDFRPRQFREVTTLPATIDLPDEDVAEVRYAYKASLIGSAQQFELTDERSVLARRRQIRRMAYTRDSRGPAVISADVDAVAPLSRRHRKRRRRAHQ